MALRVGRVGLFVALIGFGVVTGFGVGSASSYAGPPKEENEDVKKNVARNYVHEGDEALEKNELTRALDRFERAERLIPAPTVQLRLGRLYIRLGNLLAAREKLNTAAKTDLAPDASPAFYKAVIEAQRELAALEPRIPTLEISGPDLSKGAMIDKKMIEPEVLAKPIAVNPGAHTVELSCCGAQEVTPKEGEHLKVVFGAMPKPEPPKGPGLNLKFIGGLVSLGIGGVSLGVGVYSSLQVIAYRDRYAPYQARYTADQNLCNIADGVAPDKPVVGGVLTTNEKTDVQGICSGSDTARLMQIVAYPVAAIGVGVGVTLLVLSRRDSKPTASSLEVLPILGASQNGLLVRGTF